MPYVLSSPLPVYIFNQHIVSRPGDKRVHDGAVLGNSLAGDYGGFLSEPPVYLSAQ